MPKATHWILIIVLIMLPLFTVYYIDTMTTDAQTNVTDELSKSVTNAMYDTVTKSDLKFTRRETRSAFYDNLIGSLSAQLGYDITEDTKVALAQKIPAVVFCSDDGYYTVYSDIDTAGKKFVKVNAPCIPYTEVYGGKYKVRFTMHGEVTVTDITGGQEYTGPYEYLYNELGAPSELECLSCKGEYLTELSCIIGNRIGRECESLLAEHIYGKDNINTYNVDIPTSETSKVREITQPTVIAMYQGSTYSSHASTVNIYSFQAVELQDLVPYLVYVSDDGVRYYHPATTDHAKTITEHTDSGTLREVSETGALPCPHCY